MAHKYAHLAPRGHLKYHFTITQIDEKLPFFFLFLAQTGTTEWGRPSLLQLDMCTYKSYLWLTDRGFINHSNVKHLDACHSKLILCLVSLWLVLWLAELVLQGDSVWAGTDGWTWKGTHTHNVWITIYHGPRALCYTWADHKEVKYQLNLHSFWAWNLHCRILS